MRVSKDLVMLRTEIAKLRTENAQRLDLIEHLLNKHITLNYMRLIVDYMTQNTLGAINSLNCPKGAETQLQCKGWLVNLQQTYIDELRRGKIGVSNEVLSKTIVTIENNAKSAADQNDQSCASCMNRLSETLKINSALVSGLDLLASPYSGSKEELEVVGNVDPAKLEAEVLNPVAHVVRLKIMLSVFRGNSRFADFAKCTSISGGHLTYHVKKLAEHGLVAKDSAREYRLTLKGIRILALLTQLGKEK